MFDINFYMKVYELKKSIMEGMAYEKEYVVNKFEEFRSKEPVIYNIETTNACNMRCEMCPRTTMMTRSVDTMSYDVFKRIAEQIRPFSEEELRVWTDFVEEKYGIKYDDMSENHYFLHVIPKVLVLHGYGDPLLDKDMPARVNLLTQMKIPSYFSCNPANIDIKKTEEMFYNGLGYVKYSIESTDDEKHKEVRGQASNFTDAYDKICRVLDIKSKNNYKTTIVITMLNLNKTWQEEEYNKLKKAFEGKDVYIYLKSQDQQWYQEAKHKTNSIHWTEFCQFPWSSMTIKSNGESVECVEDFNNEIILGDAKSQTLFDIWNGEKYKEFRRNHFDLRHDIKCTKQCDMKLIGNYF